MLQVICLLIVDYIVKQLGVTIVIILTISQQVVQVVIKTHFPQSINRYFKYIYL